MSFGFSPSDVVTLAKLATQAYRSWRNACGDYADVTDTLRSLKLILKRISEHFPEESHAIDIQYDTPDESTRRARNHKELRHIMRGCRKVVRKLQDVVDRHQGMRSRDKRKTWERIKFACRDLQGLRNRVSEYSQQLNLFLNSVELSAINRMECSMRDIHNTLVNRFPISGKHLNNSLVADSASARGSILTSYEDDDQQVWRQFRRGLIKQGIRSDVIKAHRPELEAFLRELNNNDTPRPLPGNQISIEHALSVWGSPADSVGPSPARSGPRQVLQTIFETPVDARNVSEPVISHQATSTIQNSSASTSQDSRRRVSRPLDATRPHHDVIIFNSLSQREEQTLPVSRMIPQARMESESRHRDVNGRLHDFAQEIDNPGVNVALGIHIPARDTGGESHHDEVVVEDLPSPSIGQTQERHSDKYTQTERDMPQTLPRTPETAAKTQQMTVHEKRMGYVQPREEIRNGTVDRESPVLPVDDETGVSSNTPTGSSSTADSSPTRSRRLRDAYRRGAASPEALLEEWRTTFQWTFEDAEKRGAETTVDQMRDWSIHASRFSPEAPQRGDAGGKFEFYNPKKGRHEETFIAYGPRITPDDKCIL